MRKITVAALYKFVDLPDHEELQPALLAFCREARVAGTILLAREGINGTIAGPGAAIEAVLAYLRADPRFGDLDCKLSHCEENPFDRMKVRLKREIVTMGVPGIDPNRAVGEHVEAAGWNRLVDDPDTVLIDTRNDYEVAIGTFRGAINPGTANFRDFPAWVKRNRGLFAGKRKIAMFCTGGIRCEKATALMKAEGFEAVYHLKGGILKYLETVPQADSRWEGECFVFDNRVSVGHGLAPGPYDLCHACRRPIDDSDKSSPHYIAGVACPHCHDETSEAQRRRFRARQEQVELARRRGERHVAADHEAARARKRARRKAGG